jgi:hypothetical protein
LDEHEIEEESERSPFEEYDENLCRALKNGKGLVIQLGLGSKQDLFVNVSIEKEIPML